jgi:hypothetical protein
MSSKELQESKEEKRQLLELKLVQEEQPENRIELLKQENKQK